MTITDQFVEEFKSQFENRRHLRSYRRYFVVSDHPEAVEPLERWANANGLNVATYFRPGDAAKIFSVTMKM